MRNPKESTAASARWSGGWCNLGILTVRRLLPHSSRFLHIIIIIIVIIVIIIIVIVIVVFFVIIIIIVVDILISSFIWIVIKVIIFTLVVFVVPSFSPLNHQHHLSN